MTRSCHQQQTERIERNTPYENRFKLTYTKIGDYYFPALGIAPNSHLFGRWGMMHLQYLEENRPGLYTRLLLSGDMETLIPDLNEQAEERLATTIRQMAKVENVIEQLKADDPMRWIQLMNSIRDRTEEIVLTELIYV